MLDYTESYDKTQVKLATKAKGKCETVYRKKADEQE